MKILLLLLPLFIFGCQSFDAETIAQEVCDCNTELVKINEEIKQNKDSASQREVMALFTKAGEIYQKSQNCILNLSNAHGPINQKQYQSIRTALEKQCKDAIEPFEKSGWYQEEKTQ